MHGQPTGTWTRRLRRCTAELLVNYPVMLHQEMFSEEFLAAYLAFEVFYANVRHGFVQGKLVSAVEFRAAFLTAIGVEIAVLVEDVTTETFDVLACGPAQIAGRRTGGMDKQVLREIATSYQLMASVALGFFVLQAMLVVFAIVQERGVAYLAVIADERFFVSMLPFMSPERVWGRQTCPTKLANMRSQLLVSHPIMFLQVVFSEVHFATSLAFYGSCTSSMQSILVQEAYCFETISFHRMIEFKQRNYMYEITVQVHCVHNIRIKKLGIVHSQAMILHGFPQYPDFLFVHLTIIPMSFFHMVIQIFLTSKRFGAYFTFHRRVQSLMDTQSEICREAFATVRTNRFLRLFNTVFGFEMRS
nr:unnamed protein product [Callosobruchus chinensis]